MYITFFPVADIVLIVRLHVFTHLNILNLVICFHLRFPPLFGRLDMENLVLRTIPKADFLIMVQLLFAGRVGVPKQLFVNTDPSSIPAAVMRAGLSLPLGEFAYLLIHNYCFLLRMLIIIIGLFLSCI